MSPSTEPVVLNWSLSWNHRNAAGSSDRPPFEIYSVSPCISLECWGLNVVDASNWVYPYKFKVVGGHVCMTYEEISSIIAQYLKFTKREEP